MRAMEFFVKGFCCMGGGHFRRNHILYGVNFGIMLQFPIFNIKPALVLSVKFYSVGEFFQKQ